MLLHLSVGEMTIMPVGDMTIMPLASG